MRSPKVTKRIIPADPRYGSTLLAKFTNYVMERGKKSVARAIVWESLDIIKEKTKEEPLALFDRAIKNAAPFVEVKSRRVGGANYQIPIEVRPDRRTFLAMHWIIDAAYGRKGRPMAEKLAEELIAAAGNQGDAIKKKEDVRRMAEANRAFAHFA